MTNADFSKDSSMKYICKAIAKSAQPLAAAWATLTEVEFHIQQDMNLDTDDEKSIASPNRFALNVSKVLKQLELGLKVLGMASVQCNQKHHLDLKYKLVPSARELADKDQKMEPLLFGDNLKEHYRTIQENNRLTNLTVNKPSKKSTGQNRFSPYSPPFLL